MMAGVIVFLDKTPVPNNLTEIHFFDNDQEMLNFSMANKHRKHLVRAVPPEHQHHAPGPATKAMLEWLKTWQTWLVGTNFPDKPEPIFQAFIDEWK